MGQLNYNVHHVEANEKFWLTLGAKPITIGTMGALQFPNVLIVLNRAESSGCPEESLVDHVGFIVPNVLRNL